MIFNNDSENGSCQKIFCLTLYIIKKYAQANFVDYVYKLLFISLLVRRIFQNLKKWSRKDLNRQGKEE